VSATKQAAIAEFNESLAGGEQLSAENAAEALKTLIETHLFKKSIATSIRKLTLRAVTATYAPPPPHRHYHLLNKQTGVGVVKVCAQWKRCDKRECNNCDFVKYHY